MTHVLDACCLTPGFAVLAFPESPTLTQMDTDCLRVSLPHGVSGTGNHGQPLAHLALGFGEGDHLFCS